jgi:ABC-2 type transport system permease protein
MTTTASPQVQASTPVPVPVRVPRSSLAGEFRAVKVVWQRELIRFSQDRIRILTSLVQPLLYVFVLGTGLSSLTRGATGGVSLSTFIYPGVIALSVLFTAMFSAASIVWDREFGFLREMLVAPVRRGAVTLGKCLGGATVATLQGLIVVAIAGLVHVPYSPVMIAVLTGEMLLLGFCLTAFGLAAAVRVRQMQSIMGLMQMILMPLIFLSGSLYPLRDLPGWLNAAVKLNPITYAVHPIREVVFDHVHGDAAALARLNPPLTWWGWEVPVGVQLGVVALTGLVLLGVATVQFNRAD